MSNLNRITHVASSDLALFTDIVRKGWPEMRRRMDGAREWMFAKKGGFEGEGARSQGANLRTVAARDDRARTEAEATLRGTKVPEAVRLAQEEEIQQAGASELTAKRAWAQAGDAFSGAQHVFYGGVTRLVALHRGGNRYRKKEIKLARDPAERLAIILAAKAEKRREIERTRNAETTIATLKKQALAHLDATRGRDPFGFDVLGGELVLKPPRVALPAVHAEPGRVVATVDYQPLLVAILGDQIREAYLARIDAAFAGDTTLRIDAEEKKARLAKLRAELLELEYEEAALRVALAGDAPEIEFPPEMNPLAILGIEVLN